MTPRRKLAESQTNQAERQITAPMPQKNAVAPAASEASKHEERLMDRALEDSFPASDPPAELPPESSRMSHELDPEDRHEEYLLDEALRETFPASDPIAAYAADSARPSAPR